MFFCLRRSVYFLLAEVFFGALAFFGLLAFFVVAFLVVFFAGFAALVVVVLAVTAGDDAAAAVVVEGLAAVFFAFDALAAFFFGAAAFFFGLLAFAFPAALGLADPLDFGLAVVAFFVTGAFFFVALAVEVFAGAVAAAAVAPVLVVVALLLVVTAFFVVAFLVGEAERFRLVPPAADFDLLDERAFFVVVPLAFLLPLGVFDRLRGLAEVDFFEVRFFPPVDAADFFVGVANLKLPLAPTPFVCFNVLFFVPARKADFKC